VHLRQIATGPDDDAPRATRIVFALPSAPALAGAVSHALARGAVALRGLDLGPSGRTVTFAWTGGTEVELVHRPAGAAEPQDVLAFCPSRLRGAPCDPGASMALDRVHVSTPRPEAMVGSWRRRGWAVTRRPSGALSVVHEDGSAVLVIDQAVKNLTATSRTRHHARHARSRAGAPALV
jgi:hypothetical protein